jgi:hypothetical protein
MRSWCVLDALLLIRTNEDRERETSRFVAPKSLRSTAPSHARQTAWPPLSGPLGHGLFHLCLNSLLIMCNLFAVKPCPLFMSVLQLAVRVESARHQMATYFSKFPRAAGQRCRLSQPCTCPSTSETQAGGLLLGLHISVHAACGN